MIYQMGYHVHNWTLNLKRKSTGALRLKKRTRNQNLLGESEETNMFTRSAFGCMKDCWKGKENTIPFSFSFYWII